MSQLFQLQIATTLKQQQNLLNSLYFVTKYYSSSSACLLKHKMTRPWHRKLQAVSKINLEGRTAYSLRDSSVSSPGQ